MITLETLMKMILELGQKVDTGFAEAKKEHIKINKRLDKHEAILNEHTTILKEHSVILEKHSVILEKYGEIFKRNNLR